MASVEFKIEGLQRLERFLKKLPARIQQDSLRKAATFATTPLLTAAKAEVPQDKGGLRLRLAKKVKVYRSSGTVVAMIGVDKKKRTYFQGRKKKGTDFPTVDHPSNILHLLTFGKRNRDGSRTAPDRFLQRAHARTSAIMQARFAAKLKRDLPKDIARLKSKGKLTL